MPAQIRADLRDKELMMNGQAVQSDRAHAVSLNVHATGSMKIIV